MTITLEAKLKPLADWSLEEAAEAIGARADVRFATHRFGSISTDSRTVEAGQFFLALAGENFDGHAYCETALGRGAAGLIVSRDIRTESDIPVLRVEDTLTAYGGLARLQRNAWAGPVLAISGSVGKTTTRRLLAESLGGRHAVLEPIRNFNNLVGLPSTLLRLEARHEVAVIELGMNLPGELERLTRIARPTVAALTRIGEAHIGQFDSIEALVAAKLSLFEATESGAPLVINVDCARSSAAIGRFERDHPIVTFRGERGGPADCWIGEVEPIEPIGYRFDLHTPFGVFKRLRVNHFGRHILEDVAAAAALAHAGGFEPELVAQAVGGFSTEPLRGQSIAAGEWTFILDCYNAAPESMIGALNSLAEMGGEGRRVIVLADMLELGEASAEVHDRLLGPLRRIAPHVFFGLGPQMNSLAQTLAAEGMAASGVESADELAEALAAALCPGDRVFFKGSHGFALERVASRLAPEAGIPTDAGP